MTVSLLLTLSLSFGFIAYVLFRYYSPHSKQSSGTKKHGSLPVPKGTVGWPFVGETLDFFKPHPSDSIGSYLQRHCSMYGKVFMSNLVGGPTIVSCDRELNTFVLQNEGKLFEPAYPKAMHDILGRYSLILATGDIHKKLRSIVVNFTNHTKTDPLFLLTVQNQCILLLNSWQGRSEVNFHEDIKTLTLGIMVKKVLGIGPEDPIAREILQDFSSYMKGFVSLPIPLPGTAYTNAIKARKRLGTRVEELIKQRAMERGEEEYYLDVIMSKEELSEEKMVSVVLDILLGGYETTANLLALILYYLCRSPHVLHKLKEEHEAIRKARRGKPSNIWEDYQKMEFTHYVMYEAMRCGNIVKFVHRKALQDIKFKDYVIPSGWKVFPIFTAVHLDPSLHDDPSEFNPMRWADEGTSKKVMPFGGGVRLCPGSDIAKVEVALFLHQLLPSYTWQIKDDEMPVAHPYIEFKRGMVIHLQTISSFS